MVKIVVNIDGLNINYIKEGEGETVLILPGWGTTTDTYSSLINSISKYKQVICMDMPGFGKSDEPTSVWQLDDFVTLTKKFIAELGIKRLSLIGHSNGGRIIIKLMGSNPEFEVDRIVLIGSAGIVNKPSLSQRVRVRTYKMCKKLVLWKPVKKCFPGLLNKLQSKFGSDDYKNATPIMRGTLVKLVNEDVRDHLPSITQPTILIWGECDNATPIKDAYVMESILKDAAVIKYEGAGHYVFLERAAEVNSVIHSFLGGDKA